MSRKAYAVVPPKTEYSLTEMGWTLELVMAAMAAWGGKHRETNAEPVGAAARD